MYNFLIILSIIESLYICFMFSFFKTTKYFHHPFEILLQRTTFNFWLKHPISDDEYGSKICPFGQLMGYILGIWILYVTFYPSSIILKLNKIVWIATGIISLISNLNAFVYVIPCLLLELFKLSITI